MNLEWNCLGEHPDSFSTFCSGLRVNRNLVTLDLKNNGISHLGAIAIANMLKENCTIKVKKYEKS